VKLLVVIVNYGGFDLTRDCLETVAEQIGDVPGAAVGLCDNGSKGDDAERLAALIADRGWSGWCTLTTITPNRGFTGGNNAVIKSAMASENPPDYVLLLNNDTLLRPRALAELVAFMDAADPGVGVAGSRLEYPDATPQISAFRFMGLVNEFEGQLRLGLFSKLVAGLRVSQPVPDKPVRCDWVAGASMIIRRAVIEAIGPLDEDYYTYFDDIDYCRAAAKAGYQTWYVPASRVVHLVGQTTGITDTSAAAKRKRRAQYWFEARRRYFLKHHGPVYAAAADTAFLAGLALYRLRQKAQGKTDDLPDRFLRDFLAQSVFAQGGSLNVVQNPALG